MLYLYRITFADELGVITFWEVPATFRRPLCRLKRTGKNITAAMLVDGEWRYSATH